MTATTDERRAAYEADDNGTGDVWLDYVEACRGELSRIIIDLASKNGGMVDGDELQQYTPALADVVKLLDEVAELRRNGEIAWKDAQSA